MAAVRTSNKALRNLESLAELGKSSGSMADIFQQMQTVKVSGGTIRQQSDADLIDSDLAGQEAIVDRKLDQTGRNKITQSKAWNMLGNIIGFDTKEDWEDRKQAIDAQQDVLLRQQEDAALLATQQQTERVALADQVFSLLDEEILNVPVVSKEDERIKAGFKTELDLATSYLKSEDPDKRKFGEERINELRAGITAYHNKNEDQRLIADHNERLANARDREVAIQAQTRIDNVRLAQEKETYNRAIAVQNQFYDRTGKPYEEISSVAREVYNALELARTSTDRTALYAAGVKVAKLLDPGSVVRESEYAALVGQGSQAEQISDIINKQKSAPTDANIDKLIRLTDSLMQAAAETRQREYEVAQNQSRINGVSPNALIIHRDFEIPKYNGPSQTEHVPSTPTSVINSGVEIVLDAAGRIVSPLKGIIGGGR